MREREILKCRYNDGTTNVMVYGYRLHNIYDEKFYEQSHKDTSLLKRFDKIT